MHIIALVFIPRSHQTSLLPFILISVHCLYLSLWFL